MCHSACVFSSSIIFSSLELLISGETLGRVWKHLACPAGWGHCFASHAVWLTGSPYVSGPGLECVETRDIWLKDGHIADSCGSPTVHTFYSQYACGQTHPSWLFWDEWSHWNLESLCTSDPFYGVNDDRRKHTKDSSILCNDQWWKEKWTF